MPDAVAEQQRDVADGRACAPLKLPLSSAPAKLPVRRAASNMIGDARLAEPHREAVEREPLADDLAARRGAGASGELPRRPLSTGPLNARAGRRPARPAASRRSPGRSGRPAAGSRRAGARSVCKIIEADHRARLVPKAKLPPLADPALDRQPQRLHAAVGERPVELRDGAERGRSARARPEADRRQAPAADRPRCRARSRRRRSSARRRAAGEASLAPFGSPPPRHFDIAVDAEAARRPVIGHAAAAEDARPGAAGPDDVGICRSAPRRRRGN